MKDKPNSTSDKQALRKRSRRRSRSKQQRQPSLPSLASLESLRAVACRVLHSVAFEQKSLSTLIPIATQQVCDKDSALLQEIVYGCCRWYRYLEDNHQQFIEKPLDWDDKLAESLLKIGIYQLLFMRIPAHAAINETVQAAVELGLERFKPLINAVLRKVSQLAPFEDSTEVAINSYPDWIREKTSHNWPEQWQDILYQGTLRPPMTLRVNRQFFADEDPREAYLALLKAHEIEASACQYAPFGVQLAKPYPVSKLPKFLDGAASVQDEAAQLSCELLELQSGQKVLDACSAPGGKTCAILEAQTGVQLTALDSEAHRAALVTENLERLNLHAKLQISPAEELDKWWDGELFDRILLDAPCSASAVIRRHPDIKLLRQEGDIKALAELQMTLLKTLWACLKPGGILVYATCSIFSQENSRIIERFLKAEATASLLNIDANWGIDTGFGRQLFPQQNGHDGFFYARLKKS
jgi:16S rRNA (cytosine967-C5)-methyltransferase